MAKFSPRRVVFVALLIGLLSPKAAPAWIDTGHKIIAMIVWDELAPTTRAKVTAILKQHPRYEKDLLFGAPRGLSPAESDRHAFITAATWPDAIRSQNHPMHVLFSHPNWHFIDIPYVVGNQPLPTPQPVEKSGPTNIVEALNKTVADLKNPNLTAADKAIALCWVVHLCGDIHQPLHCETMISAEFPEGDHGGNLIQVLRDPPYPNSRVNLHLLWDELPGEFKSREIEGYLARSLRADPQYSRERLKDALAVQDFAAWAKESHDLAVSKAYLNGELKFVPVRDAKAERTPIPGVPEGYMEAAEQTAMKQVILAGYRTADVLNSMFGE